MVRFTQKAGQTGTNSVSTWSLQWLVYIRNQLVMPDDAAMTAQPEGVEAFAIIP